MRALTTILATTVLLLPPLALGQEEEASLADRILYGGEVTSERGAEGFRLLQRDRVPTQRPSALEVEPGASSFRLSEHVSLLTEIRSDNLDVPEPYALYVRVRPWLDRAFDIQCGPYPTGLRGFRKGRRYDIDNPLIGAPLAYQYPTTIRSDSAPENMAQVLRQRGFGARGVSYPIGDPAPMAGVPLVNPLRWDTGVQVRLGHDPLELAVALTQGRSRTRGCGTTTPGSSLPAAWGGVRSSAGRSDSRRPRGEYVSDGR